MSEEGEKGRRRRGQWLVSPTLASYVYQGYPNCWPCNHAIVIHGVYGWLLAILGCMWPMGTGLTAKSHRRSLILMSDTADSFCSILLGLSEDPETSPTSLVRRDCGGGRGRTVSGSRSGGTG